MWGRQHGVHTSAACPSGSLQPQTHPRHCTHWHTRLVIGRWCQRRRRRPKHGGGVRAGACAGSGATAPVTRLWMACGLLMSRATAAVLLSTRRGRRDPPCGIWRPAPAAIESCDAGGDARRPHQRARVVRQLCGGAAAAYVPQRHGGPGTTSSVTAPLQRWLTLAPAHVGTGWPLDGSCGGGGRHAIHWRLAGGWLAALGQCRVRSRLGSAELGCWYRCGAASLSPRAGARGVPGRRWPWAVAWWPPLGHSRSCSLSPCVRGRAAIDARLVARGAQALCRTRTNPRAAPWTPRAGLARHVGAALG